MKNFIKIITMCFICFILFSTAFAGNGNIKQILSKDKIENSIEKEIISELYDKSFNQVKDDLHEKGINGIKKVKKDSMYKVFRIKDVDIIEAYNLNGSFADLISDDYVWEIPLYNDKEKIVSTCTIKKAPLVKDLKDKGIKFKEETEKALKEEEGKWQISLIGNYIPISGAELISDRDRIEEFIFNNSLEEIQDIKVVTLPYYTYILYIRDKNGEFGVPFNAREDLVGLTNGKLYNMTDLMKVFEVFLKNSKGMEGDMFGGVIANTDYIKGSNTLNVLIFSGLVTLTTVVGIFTIIIRRRKVSCSKQ